jgi:outer membrane protein insertion porin family
MEEAYRTKGYPDVRITYRQEKASETGFTGVVFTVDEGSRAVLDDVQFSGNSALDAGTLKKVVKIGNRDWWKVWDLSKKVSNEQLDADVKAIQLKYQDAGYMNAKVVGVDRIPSGDKVNILFRIQEGTKYDVTAVAIEGMSNYPREELLPSLQLEAGAGYSATAIKDDIRTIRDYYGARGFADVNINPRIVSSGPNQLAVTYQISEGKKSFVRKINIDGNTKTRDEVIRRELALVPGEEYSTAKMEISKKRLDNLGYFGAAGAQEGGVDVFPRDTEQPGYKDVDITVREKPTASLSVGAAFSSIQSLYGSLDVTQTNFDLFNWPNFTGAGQRFRLGLKYGTRRKDAEIELTEPWFMGERLALGGELYYKDLNYYSDVYDQTNIGAAISLRKPIGEHTYVKGEYRLQQIEIDPDSDASPEIKKEGGDFLQSQLTASVVYDTRDSLFLPRKGAKVSASLSYSGLGGDVETYGFSANAIQYFKLPWDTVFSLEGSLETVDGSGDVPIFERLFLGGAQNLRGFDYRDVGPKDSQGEPLGGRTAAFITAQYNFPIMEKVRGVVFADLGVVSNDALDFGGDVNSDIGIGLHLYLLPQGPLRLEFGIPMQSDEQNDSGGKFNFNIGYEF